VRDVALGMDNGRNRIQLRKQIPELDQTPPRRVSLAAQLLIDARIKVHDGLMLADLPAGETA
jgi:hypothetical protein